jgi:ribosome-associated protein
MSAYDQHGEADGKGSDEVAGVTGAGWVWLPVSCLEVPGDDLMWRFSRSGGPGGQNVNKVETRVELRFCPGECRGIPERQRDVIVACLGAGAELRVVVSEHRSQRRNREAALARLDSILAEALRPRLRRHATRMPEGERRRRLESKRHRSTLKQQRNYQPEAD